MVIHDRTDMRGAGETFLTTHWSMIEGVQECQDKDRALIGLLLDRYWKPVYCWLRREGYSNEEAKDLTQCFFHEVVPGRRLLDRADPSKGRFRFFLLHALNQYLIDEQRRESAQKRIPKARLAHLEVIDPPSLPQAMTESDAEQCFNYAWKADLLDQVLTQLRVWYMQQGMETHWCLFRDRLVRPSLDDVVRPSLAGLCRQYEIVNETKASNMLRTAKRRFHTLLREYVRQTVISGEIADREQREVFKFL